MRILRWVLLILVGIYVLIEAAACSFQERFIYFPDPTLAALPEGSPYEELLIETPDGETLLAWTLEAAPGCPTILFFHGNGGHLERDPGRYERLREAGVGMLALSWRGYAGSTGTPSQDGLYTDAQAAYDTLIASGLAPENIVVQGFSLGTGPATKLAAENPAGALVLEAPYYSILRIAQRKAPIFPVGIGFRNGFRSDRYIGDVTEPILIVHGSADSVIPVEDSADLADLAPVGVARIVFKGSEHSTLVRDGLYEDAVWPFLVSIYPDCPFAPSDEVSTP